MRKSNTLTYNYNCLMRTITFKVHPITPTSPRNMLATIFKSILILFAFEHIMHGHIKEREREREREKKYLILISQKYQNFAMPKHTNVIHDWRVLVVRWLFMLFS